MKKILFYILIFTTITGSLFGVFGDFIIEKQEVSAQGLFRTEPTFQECKTSAFKDIPACKAILERGDNYEKNIIEKDYNIGCNISPGSWGGCVTLASYGLYTVSAVILGGSGSIFNTMLSFSLSSDIINQPFVIEAWRATRDFANMLFILVLVVISISIIIDYGYKSRGLIVNVIIIAFAVNFSLFAAKIIIDTSNIVALGFYDAISAPYEGGDLGKNSITDIESKDISGAVTQSFNPTEILSPDSFKQWKKDYIDSGSSEFTAAVMLAFVFLFGAAINLYLAYLFFLAGFIFVVRVVWLWIIMALAPLAFISFAIPQFKYLWKKWWDALFNKSFCIVVFMFMIWLTLLIIGGDYLSGIFKSHTGSSYGSLLELLVMITMQYMIVVVLLSKSLSATKKMCDDGGIGDKVFGMAKGLGLAAVTGGTSVLARQGLGKVASIAVGAMEKRGVGTGAVGRKALQFSKGVENYKFGTKEGFKGRKERVEKEELKYIQSLPKEVYEYENGEIKLDNRGNKVIKKDREGREIKPQEERIANLERTSPVSWALGSRAGQLAAVESHKKLKEKRDELKVSEDRLAELKQDFQIAVRGENDLNASSTRVLISEENRNIAKLKSGIKKLEGKTGDK